MADQSYYGTGRRKTSTARVYMRAGKGDVTVNNGQNDVWVVTTDAMGNIITQKSFGGNNQDFAYGIASAQGALIITGDTQSTNGDIIATQGGLDAVLLKLE